jgi:hypothetical protein
MNASRAEGIGGSGRELLEGVLEGVEVRSVRARREAEKVTSVNRFRLSGQTGQDAVANVLFVNRLDSTHVSSMSSLGATFHTSSKQASFWLTVVDRGRRPMIMPHASRPWSLHYGSPSPPADD